LVFYIFSLIKQPLFCLDKNNKKKMEKDFEVINQKDNIKLTGKISEALPDTPQSEYGFIICHPYTAMGRGNQ